MRIARTLRPGLLAIGLFALHLSPVVMKAAQRAGNEFGVFRYLYAHGSKGIYAYRFRPATGALTSLGLVAETPHPSYIAVHPNGRVLYATNEHEGADPPGVPNTVSAFAIDHSTGKLTLLNKVSAQGEGPCHLSVDKTGATLLVANYRSGSVVALPIQKDGHLGEATAVVQHQGSSVHPVRQRGPHAHYVTPSPDNRFALAVDLGLDRVFTYRLTPSKGTLTFASAAETPPGSLPRHLAFHPSQKYVYVNGEATSTVSTFAYETAPAR